MGSAQRIAAVDIGRTVALAAMVVFHFTYDLAIFGLIDPATMAERFWVLFPQAIAGSFIFLSGVSLVLAGRGPFKARKFAWRLAQIGGAAVLVSVGTYVAMGSSFVRFGILHCLFVCALVGPWAVRLPGAALIGAGAVIVAAPHVLDWPVLQSNAWLWLGLTKTIPFMVDYVPLVPWFGVFLLGLGLAKRVPQSGWAQLVLPDSKAVRALSWPGQHSLMIYLVHQLVLFAGIAAWIWLTG